MSSALENAASRFAEELKELTIKHNVILNFESDYPEAQDVDARIPKYGHFSVNIKDVSVSFVVETKDLV